VTEETPQAFGRSRKAEEDEMDLTPMVDVTFLLLIFFMITAAFVLQKSIEVPPINEDSASPTQTVEDLEEDSIVVRIDADNTFWIGAPLWDEEQSVLSHQAMLVKLREAKQGRKGSKGPAKMLVQAHGDARHERVVQALDAGSGVGMEDIRLLSYEDGDLDI